MFTIDIEKFKVARARLELEKKEREDKLKHALEVKEQYDQSRFGSKQIY